MIALRKLSQPETLALFPDSDETMGESMARWAETAEQFAGTRRMEGPRSDGLDVEARVRAIRRLPKTCESVESACVLKDGHHFVRFRDRWDDGREHCTGCGKEQA